MDQDIKSEFATCGFALSGPDEEEILKKCLTFCINYKLKPSDLVSSWEVYFLNRQLPEPVVQNVEMDGFLLHLQNEQKEALLKEESNLHFYSSRDVEMILNNDEEDMTEEVIHTPIDKSIGREQINSFLTSNGDAYSSEKPSELVTPFGRRMNKFVAKFNINNLPDLESGHNGHAHETLEEDDIINRVKEYKRCSLELHRNGLEPGCRFMYDRIEDRFNALDNRIRRQATAICATGLYDEPMDPTVASQRNLFAVGMIWSDEESQLNEKSIMLQSSVEHAGGLRVRLDLCNLSQFFIFPGQIVGVKGCNPSGHCLVASKLVDSVPLSANSDMDSRPAKKKTLDDDIQSNVLPHAQEQISMIIASGPFTTTDNLLFEPLKELLAYASRKLPQLLIMLGPFIDSEHPEIKTGSTDRSFDEIFHMEVLARLQDYVEFRGSEARVILVPSIRDANHDFVFPQPAFDVQLPNLKQQIASLPNPGTFEANQVKVGCCTVDVLRHLSGVELSRIPKDGTPNDRMSRLANHILSQRSFYPLYPPAEDIPLDFSLSPQALDITSIPDILILPSDMKYFIKVLSLGGISEGEEQMKCICINPGRLAKGEGGGTFAELSYYGNADKINASIISI